MKCVASEPFTLQGNISVSIDNVDLTPLFRDYIVRMSTDGVLQLRIRILV